jgi:hypothetical protein
MTTLVKSIIDEAIVTERFACNVNACKGACCTLPGGRGAPLDDDEVAQLAKAFPVVRRYLSAPHLRAIEAQGMVEGEPGNFHTTCVDDRDCVFVVHEEGIARCSLEKAFFLGETQWRKPLSCHLFPVRVSRDGSRLHYERIGECLPGVERGVKEDVPLYEFLREPLERKFGAQWYEEFREECRQMASPAAPRNDGPQTTT